jgi:Raf kinase inhibitor-like YbhB/YbcL family protein
VGARRLLAAALAAAAFAGCGGGDDEEGAALPEAPGENIIKLSSPDIADGQAIPARFTCDGEGAKPTIVWREVRQDAVELVLVVEDPDAPDGTFTHWTVFGLPASGGSGLAEAGNFPAGVKQGTNSAGNEGWAPPCPPAGDGPHRYVFTMYGLPEGTTLEPGAPIDAVKAAIESAVSHGRFIGTYERK